MMVYDRNNVTVFQKIHWLNCVLTAKQKTEAFVIEWQCGLCSTECLT